MAKLERLLRIDRAAIVVCRGRRRIGKSTLIQRFGAKYPKFHEFQGLAPRENLKKEDQLANFSRQMAEQFGLPAFNLASWQDAFSLLANQTAKDRRVILLDEISWMASRDRDFPGHLKIAWDTKFKKNTRLILVLCGSVSSWIDENILKGAGFMGRVSLTLTLDELPLPLCSMFWGKRRHRVSDFEKFKLLSVTGGVPRYLEEINPTESTESNIKAMCFEDSGILAREFSQIFNDTFARRAGIYRRAVEVLVDGYLSFSRICERLSVDPNGAISKYLEDLVKSGFLARDYVHDLKQGRRGKLSKYRLRDNYTRFYLKYVEPVRDRIEKGLYRYKSIENLPGFETTMGLQLENLVLNNLNVVTSLLGIQPDGIVSASPYFQKTTARRKGCQVDLLIQTRNTFYVCEVKFRNRIEASVIGEVQEKISRLKIPRTMSVRPVLIHVGEIAPAIESEGFFDRIISLEALLE